MRLDALGAFFLVWSLPMTLLGSVYAVGYLRPYFDTSAIVGLHFALLNLTSLSFVLVYTGEHALVFLLGWEIAALAAWLLVIWDYRNQKIRFAGFNYLVSTHIGLIFLVAAFMILYTHIGVVGPGQLRRWLRANPGSERNLVFLLLVTSFGLKSAFFPFHSWLPRAHAAAPAHVSALMSGVIHKAGLYALVRFVLLIGKPEEWMGWFLIGFSRAVGGDRRALHRRPARPEAPARLLVDRERRHRRHRLRRRLPGPGLGQPGARGARASPAGCCTCSTTRSSSACCSTPRARSTRRRTRSTWSGWAACRA